VVEREIKKLRREAEERPNEDNALEGKTTQDCCFHLQSGKKLKTHLSCEGGFPE